MCPVSVSLFLCDSFENSDLQSGHKDKITQSWPKVPGDLRFSLAFHRFPVVFLGSQAPGDLIFRCCGSVVTVTALFLRSLESSRKPLDARENPFAHYSTNSLFN